jgi:hypothetical protein
MMQRYPNQTFGMYTSTLDHSQIYYFNRMLGHESGRRSNNNNSSHSLSYAAVGDEWWRRAAAILARLAEQPNFRHFVSEGTTHCTLAFSDAIATSTANSANSANSATGTGSTRGGETTNRFLAWLTAMLEQGHHGGDGGTDQTTGQMNMRGQSTTATPSLTLPLPLLPSLTCAGGDTADCIGVVPGCENRTSGVMYDRCGVCGGHGSTCGPPVPLWPLPASAAAACENFEFRYYEPSNGTAAMAPSSSDSGATASNVTVVDTVAVVKVTKVSTSGVYFC